MFKQSPKRHIPKQNPHASPNCKHTGSLATSRPHDSIYQCQIPKKERNLTLINLQTGWWLTLSTSFASLFDKQRCRAGLRPRHCSQLRLMSAANCPADGGLPFIVPIICLCPSGSSLRSLAMVAEGMSSIKSTSLNTEENVNVSVTVCVHWVCEGDWRCFCCVRYLWNWFF